MRDTFLPLRPPRASLLSTRRSLSLFQKYYVRIVYFSDDGLTVRDSRSERRSVNRADACTFTRIFSRFVNRSCDKAFIYFKPKCALPSATKYERRRACRASNFSTNAKHFRNVSTVASFSSSYLALLLRFYDKCSIIFFLLAWDAPCGSRLVGSMTNSQIVLGKSLKYWEGNNGVEDVGTARLDRPTSFYISLFGVILFNEIIYSNLLGEEKNLDSFNQSAIDDSENLPSRINRLFMEMYSGGNRRSW